MVNRNRANVWGIRFACVALGAALAGFLGGCPEPAKGTLLLRFAQITDIHVTDGESPARMVRMDPFIGAAWRPQEAYAAHVLDATLRVLNGHHTGTLEPQRLLDFVVDTGDSVDNAQFNEFRWFLDTMDGKAVTPDSGAHDGALLDVPAADNPYLEFHPAGLDPSIPWYIAHGNHDALSVGNFGVDDSAADPADWTSPQIPLVADVVGLHRIAPDYNSLWPTSDQSAALLLANAIPMDPATLKLDVDALVTGPIPADPQRHYLNMAFFLNETLLSSSAPSGHGLDTAAFGGQSARYSVRPRADVPVRLIVLDTVAPDPISGVPAFYGVLTREQFHNFLKPEMRKAQQNKEWVIIASHHPSADFDYPYPRLTVSQWEFRAYLTLQSNVIAHICGHTHRNHIETVYGPRPYVEIETCSLIDYPQEGRLFELYYNEQSGTMHLDSTMFSHMEDPTPLSKEGFRRAALDDGKSPAPKSMAFDPAAVFPMEDPTFDATRDVPGFFPWSESPTKEVRFGAPESRDFSIALPRAPL